MSSETLVIYPYLLNGTCWVFDDARTGLKEEAFVMGYGCGRTRMVGMEIMPTAEGRSV